MSTAQSLSNTQSELTTAYNEARTAASQFAAYIDRSKVLLDGYSNLGDMMRRLSRALSPLEGDIDTRTWNAMRVPALLSLKNMISSLEQGGLLKGKCQPIADMIGDLCVSYEEQYCIENI